MGGFIGHSIRFILFVLVQVIVFNNLTIGWGIMPMVYPLFLMLLPVNINVFLLMLIAFAMGISIDSISDTYGLHASSLVMMAYFRPVILKAFEPREGYESMASVSLYSMGSGWFLSVFGILLLIHHLWFFTLEIFNIYDILFILQKTILSAVLSFILCLFIQFIFISKPRER